MSDAVPKPTLATNIPRPTSPRNPRRVRVASIVTRPSRRVEANVERSTADRKSSYPISEDKPVLS